MNFKYLFVFLMISLLIPISVSGDEEFYTSNPDYLVGDFLEYNGYSQELFNELKNTIKIDNQNINIEIEEENNLKVEISSFEECQIKEFSGFCQRAKTNHFMNISLKWPFDSTNYLNDEMNLLITTNEESLTPRTESPWSWTKRVVVITSIFKTDSDEEQSVESRISTEIITNKLNSEPETISVGYSWVSVENREIITEISSRENYGLWEKTTSYNNETLQRIFSANSVELLNNELGVTKVLSISEGDISSGNYSIAYIDELGFSRKIEKYTNDNLDFSTELIDYRYLRTPDPSAKQSIQTEAICFIVFLFSSLIFLSLVFVNEFRNKKRNLVQINQTDELEEKLRQFNQEKKRKTGNTFEHKITYINDNEQKIEQNKESELKTKLRDFYLTHNPAKLEFLNEIVKKMEENQFGNSEDHISLLNSQLIERYGVDLEGNRNNDAKDVELPESSRKFKELMDNIFED